MNVESAEVALAYTYAWWLTGTEQTARTAVLAAIERPDVPGADPELRIEILLRRTRAAAVSAPTMCPASELALLHDAIGIGLDSAAGLAHVDAREARTELAHGRLEALGPDVEFEITQPERLGGLAVGNPADVAATRQNESLHHLREMILTGRDELIDLAKIDVPSDLLDQVARQQRGSPAEEQLPQPEERPTGPAALGEVESEPLESDWFDVVDTDAVDTDVVDTDVADTGHDLVGDEQAGGTVGDESDSREDANVDVDETPPDGLTGDPEGDLEADEIDLSDAHEAPELGTPGVPPRRRPWGWLLVILLIALLAGLYLWRTAGRTSDEPDVDDPTAAAAPADAAPADADPADADPADPAEDDLADPAAGPSQPDDAATAVAAGTTPTPPEAGSGFEVARAGVAVGIGSDPDFGNPSADPFDPVSITIEYDGAEANDALIAEWTVDGQAFGVERADLSPGLETSRFTRQVPQAGWPSGQHTLTLSLERTGEVVGTAEFRVIGGTTLEEQEAAEAAEE